MFKKLIFLIIVVLVLGLANVASALYLKVDLAYPLKIPDDPNYQQRRYATSKDGWFIWSSLAWWDLYQHDMQWAHTDDAGPPPPEGILGTGVNMLLKTVAQDGHAGFQVYGLIAQGDGAWPLGEAKGEPIANSYLTIVREVGGRDLQLVITGLEAGEYYLTTYHNDHNDLSTYPLIMPRVKVSGTGVVQTRTALNVTIQRETVDANLVPSEVAFITAGTNDVEITYETPTNGRPVVNAFILTSSKGIAINPSPPTMADQLCLDDVLNLCWEAAPLAGSHDVYFGTDWDDVNDANTSVTLDVYKGNQALDVNCYEPVGIELGKTYYWRIDEVNETNPDSPWKGDVWQFTTNDGTAYDPDPFDGRKVLPLDVVLSWMPGCLATTHDVYIGTDFDDVNNATSTSHPNVDYDNVPVNSYDPPGELDYFTWYYWRVDEVGSPTYKGEVWSFRTQSEAADPNLLVWYKFDEAAPNEIAYDSSGHEYDGAVYGPNDSWEPYGGRFLGCRIFGGAIGVPIPAVSTISNAISISAWLKDVTNDGSGTVFDLWGAMGIKVQASVPDRLSDSETSIIRWRAGNESNDVLDWDIGYKVKDLEDWHFWVFTKDEVADEMKIYLDAGLIASKTGTMTNLATVHNNAAEIGGWVGGADHLNAKMDDFRMYDYSLSDPEIMELFRGGAPGLAWFPTPRDYAVEMPRDVNLTWRPGDFVVSHDVYFGTDWDDVNDANTTVTLDVYKGNREPNKYDPCGLLELDATYYWRIDEVNDANTDSPWKGRVWRFKEANYLIIDDMEAYDEVTNAIYYTWIDGSWTGNGSYLYLGSSLYTPADPVHGGQQSMKYEYDSGDSYGQELEYYSEIERTFDTAQDWTEADVKILTLFFYGDPNNDANATEQMYVGLEDTRGADSYAEVRYGHYDDEDINSIKKQEWTPWDISLADFTGVIPSDINKVYVGFGDRDNHPDPGGKGTVHFDNIRLYPQKCIPSRLQPAFDFTDDCVVDFGDVGAMAEHWLRTDAYLAVEPPNPAGLVGWWRLDEGDGNTAADSSVYANHGTISGSYSWVAGYENSAVQFVNGSVLVPDAPELKPHAEVSASAWVYYSGDPGNDGRVVAKGKGNFETYYLQMGAGNVIFFVGDVNGTKYAASSNKGIHGDEWIHLAGTYDGAIVKCYVNGQVMGTNNEANSISLSQDPEGLGIGNKPDANDRPFKGIIDEVRVYDYALSDAEVAYFAADPTGYVPLRPRVNIYDEELKGHKAINFRDFTVLLEIWHEEKLWPPEE
jgi:hypothetical protein